MDKVNREFMFATCGLLSGLLTIAQPWPISVVGFGTLNALKAIFMGAIDAGERLVGSTHWAHNVVVTLNQRY